MSRNRIDDFGERIPGAKKHRTLDYLDKLRAPSLGAKTSLAALWPTPKYDVLADEGCDPKALAFVHAMRDIVPRPPSRLLAREQWHAGAAPSATP